MVWNRIGLVLLIFIVLAGLTATWAKAEAELRDVDCWFKTDSIHRVVCSELSVPVDWNSPNDRRFKVPVVRLLARKNGSMRPPIVFLPGGPGDPAYLTARHQVLFWQGLGYIWADDRDLIIFEPRGSTASKPSLNCPKLNDPKLWAGLWLQGRNPPDWPSNAQRAQDECMQRHLDAGIPLNAVNRHQIAQDVRALIVQLGYPKAALLGSSYGSTYAMTIMEEFPEIVSEVVLDSVFPPEATTNLLTHLAFGRSIEKIFAHCDGNEKCKSSYPDLKGTLFRVLSRFKQEPRVVRITLGDTGEEYSTQVNEKMLLFHLRTLMSRSDNLKYIPFVIQQLDSDNTETLNIVVRDSIRDSYKNYVSVGAARTAGCYDMPLDLETIDLSTLPDNERTIAEFELWMYEIDACRKRGIERAPIHKRKQLTSSIPTLIIAGEFDPATPPFLARMAAAGLTKSHLFVFPFETHSPVFTNGCAKQLAAAFFKSPEERPSKSCLARQTLPNFE